MYKFILRCTFLIIKTHYIHMEKVFIVYLWCYNVLHMYYRMRQCGEDLLVEMSEVLFNELAFFRLMEGLGEPPSSLEDFTHAATQVYIVMWGGGGDRGARGTTVQSGGLHPRSYTGIPCCVCGGGWIEGLGEPPSSLEDFTHAATQVWNSQENKHVQCIVMFKKLKILHVYHSV